MKHFCAIALLILLSAPELSAQDNKRFAKAMRTLRSFATKDSAGIQAAVNRWWNERRKEDQIPLTSTDSAVFLFRGSARTVAWAGDFNGWGSKPFPNKGKRIRNTDIWFLACSFPPKARLDYKVILNGNEWILDPDNPHQQFTGVGGGTPNSELRMPEWRVDPYQLLRKGTPAGRLMSHRIFSRSLGYEVAYSLYLPAGTADPASLPAFYVTDGSEYLDERLGHMTRTLDNLLAAKRIQPIRVVFVDARDPANTSSNRRMGEMSLNENYLAFFSDELIPAVESPSVAPHSAERGILGTSLGGLNAAYFAFRRPDLFNRVGIQSPAFWYKPEIYTLAQQAQPGLRVCMTAGTIYDASDEAQKMKELLEKHGHSVQYIETPEGHSWGNWKNLLDDILVNLYPPR